MDLKVSENTLVVEPRKRKKYTMKELLDQCDFSLPISEEEQEWLDLRPVGGGAALKRGEVYFVALDPIRRPRAKRSAARVDCVAKLFQ